MNLHDLVRRGDRMVQAPAGVEAIEPKLPGGTQRAVRIDAGATLRLRDAHEATCLRTFPAMPGWRVHMDGSHFTVWLESPGSPRRRLHAVEGACARHEVMLDWPVPVPPTFDLVLETELQPAMIAVGPLFNARTRLLPVLRGRGVEVGPGARPSVLPEPERTVSYVEKMPLDDWARTYAKHELDEASARQWNHYVVDSAHRLDRFEAGSLDFIFSSHVFEHLVQPLQVLRNWWSRLAPGGVIAGVVPDARYTFDLRQPLTTVAEFLAPPDDLEDAWTPSEAMYARWCRHTAPDTTPASLRARDYSIHVSYFSPDSFRTMLDLFGMDDPPAALYMDSVTNGKDFGFLIAKP